jgi:UDP-N-acetylmuramate--alanine ligase
MITRTRLTYDSQKEGIQIHFEDDLNKIDKEATVIVYTPAIPAEHGN